MRLCTYLSFNEMTDSHFSHDRNCYSFDNLFNHMGVALKRMRSSSGMIETGLPYVQHRLEEFFSKGTVTSSMANLLP